MSFASRFLADRYRPAQAQERDRPHPQVSRVHDGRWRARSRPMHVRAQTARQAPDHPDARALWALEALPTIGEDLCRARLSTSCCRPAAAPTSRRASSTPFGHERDDGLATHRLDQGAALVRWAARHLGPELSRLRAMGDLRCAAQTIRHGGQGDQRRVPLHRLSRWRPGRWACG